MIEVKQGMCRIAQGRPDNFIQGIPLQCLSVRNPLVEAERADQCRALLARYLICQTRGDAITQPWRQAPCEGSDDTETKRATNDFLKVNVHTCPRDGTSQIKMILPRSHDVLWEF